MPLASVRKVERRFVQSGWTDHTTSVRLRLFSEVVAAGLATICRISIPGKSWFNAINTQVDRPRRRIAAIISSIDL